MPLARCRAVVAVSALLVRALAEHEEKNGAGNEVRTATSTLRLRSPADGRVASLGGSNLRSAVKGGVLGLRRRGRNVSRVLPRKVAHSRRPMCVKLYHVSKTYMI